VLRQYFVAVQNVSSCCLPAAYGIEQGFSDYASRPNLGRRNVILGRETNWLEKSNITIFVKFTRKLKISLELIYFFCIFIFKGNIVLYAFICLLGHSVSILRKWSGQGRNQLFITGEQFSWNFIRWRHHVYSTVVQLFRKLSQISSLHNISENEDFSVLMKMQTEPSGQSKN